MFSVLRERDQSSSNGFIKKSGSEKASQEHWQSLMEAPGESYLSFTSTSRLGGFAVGCPDGTRGGSLGKIVVIEARG